MQMTLKILVGLIALLMAFMGLNVMLNPADAAQQFAVTPEGIAGLSTLRGDIGGMFVTSTVLLALGLWRGQDHLFPGRGDSDGSYCLRTSHRVCHGRRHAGGGRAICV